MAVSQGSDGDEAERPPKREPDFVLRSNTVALPLSLIVLVATVVAVYYFVPVRRGELFVRAAEEHRAAAEPDLPAPTPDQLSAWSVGVFGTAVPWPTEGVVATGARAIEIQRLRAGIVGYDAGGQRVSVVIQRARDAPPRKRRLADGDEVVLSWRVAKWTLVAIGPAATVATWAPPLGAPAKLLKTGR